MCSICVVYFSFSFHLFEISKCQEWSLWVHESWQVFWVKSIFIALCIFQNTFRLFYLILNALMDTFIILFLLSWNVCKHKRSVLTPNWMADTLFWSLFTFSCFTAFISLQLTRFIMIKIKGGYLKNTGTEAVMYKGIRFAFLTAHTFFCLIVSVLPLLKKIKQFS